MSATTATKIEVGERVRVNADALEHAGQEGTVTENIGTYPPVFQTIAKNLGKNPHIGADALFVNVDDGPDELAVFADEVEVIA